MVEFKNDQINEKECIEFTREYVGSILNDERLTERHINVVHMGSNSQFPIARSTDPLFTVGNVTRQTMAWLLTLRVAL